MNINIPDQDVSEILAALQHGSQSIHHPRCSIKKTNHCDCHVEKAARGLALLQKAVANKAESQPAE